MNERIDELMIRAGARFDFLHGVHYDNFQYREFAKLIVLECASICYNSNLEDSDLHAQNLLYEFNIDDRS